MEVLVKKTMINAELPKYQHEGDAGADLVSVETLVIDPGETKLVHTGLHVSIPEGFEGQVRSRSGLALKNNIFVLNSPGTIDSNYRGEIGVILTNFGDKIFLVESGMRIAQLIIAPVMRVDFTEVNELDLSERSYNGFGSSGLKG